MILRKPYAILIKYFKLIHIIMFISFAYIVFALRKLFVFFSSYIKTGSFTYTEDIVNIYVPWILIFVVILLLGLAIGILLLMHKKEKPVLFYRIMIGYCIFLLAIIIYFMVFFKSLDDTFYEPLKVVVNRDISLFAYIFNFFFVAFTFIRGFGFDIKKFSFDRDKKELHLEDSDSEEYELNVNIEKDDVKSFFNRHKRELMYYVKQNKAFLLTVGIITLVSLTLYFSYDFFVVNKVYQEGDNVTVRGIVYRVNNSIISNVDKYGQEISSTDEYLIINMNIVNDVRTGYLDEEALRVHIDDDYYYPHSISCDLFSDLGVCYKNQELKVNSDNNFIIVYKIKKNYNKIYLEILKNKGDSYQYSKVKLAYTKAEIKEVTNSIQDGFEVNNKQYIINKFNIENKASYKYKECIEDKCNEYIKKVIPNTGEVILELEINDLDELPTEFINSAVGIKYNDKIYSGKTIKLIAKHDNTLYYSVPSFLMNSSEYNLVITTRKTKYNYVIKGVSNE